MSKLPKCPKCGKEVIEFTFAEKTQWYHVVGGMPQPMSPACKAPKVSADR